MFRYILNSSLGELIVVDAPKGWESKKYSISRSETYHGVMITVSAELEFWGAAYDYLSELDELEDSEATCTVEIQRYNDAIDGYKKEFKSNLDFNEKKETVEGSQRFVSFPTYSDDFSNKILEREDIEIPYDRLTTLDDTEIIPFLNEYFTVSVLGIEALDKTVLTVSEYLNRPSNSVFYPSIVSGSSADYWVPTTYQAPLFPLSEEAVNASAFFVPKNSQGVINGVINLKFIVAFGSGITLSVGLDDYKSGDTDNPINVYSENNITPGGGYDIEVDIAVPIDNYEFDSNTRLVLRVSYSGSTVSNILETINDIEVVSKSLPTDCNFVPPFEVATRLIESITSEPNAVDSDFFGRTDSPTIYDEDGKGSLCFNTNGKLVRGFPVGQVIEEEDKVAQLSFKFKEWFQNNEKIYNIGAGVVYDSDTYKLKIEDKKYFYGSDVILEIGRDVMEVNSFTRNRDTTHYYGAIKTGSQFESPEEISGLEEYNNVENYSGVLVNANELDLVSTYIYGAYPFEFARRKQYIGTETEDYRYDNYVMQMVMRRDGENIVQQTNFGFNTLTGLELVTTPINLDITPQRNLRNNWGWIISTGYKKQRDTVLKYNTSETVTDLTSKKNDEAYLVDENNDIKLDELESAYFSGNTDSFNAPLSSELFDLLRENPYGLIKYWNPLKSEFTFGWLKQTSTEPVNSSTNWELINGYGFTEDVPAYRLLEDGNYRLLEDDGIRQLE